MGQSQTATYIAGIREQTASGGVVVYVDIDGKLGTVTSSARFKDQIKPMDKASEAILALKPVTFRYKKEIDPARYSAVRVNSGGCGTDESSARGARQGGKSQHGAL